MKYILLFRNYTSKYIYIERESGKAEKSILLTKWLLVPFTLDIDIWYKKIADKGQISANSQSVMPSDLQWKYVSNLERRPFVRQSHEYIIETKPWKLKIIRFNQ